MFVVWLRPSLANISTLLVSITTLRDDFKKHIELFVDDVSKFGMHSIKSGAASNPAYGRIPGDLLDIHAGEVSFFKE